MHKELRSVHGCNLKFLRSPIAYIALTLVRRVQSGDEATSEKKDLEHEIKRCVQRLDRAEKLTSGLEEENVRCSSDTTFEVLSDTIIMISKLLRVEIGYSTPVFWGLCRRFLA